MWFCHKEQERQEVWSRKCVRRYLRVLISFSCFSCSLWPKSQSGDPKSANRGSCFSCSLWPKFQRDSGFGAISWDAFNRKRALHAGEPFANAREAKMTFTRSRMLFRIESATVVADGEAQLSAVCRSGDPNARGRSVSDRVRDEFADDAEHGMGRGVRHLRSYHMEPY